MAMGLYVNKYKQVRKLQQINRCKMTIVDIMTKLN